MPPDELTDELTAELETVAVDVAGQAARFVVRARAGAEATAAGLTVASKTTSTDLVTEVDRASEQLLVDAIARARPDDAVIGEEGGWHSAPGRSSVEWIVDPIDGTVNFVLGIPAYSVSVAARMDGRIVAGCVADVVRGEVFRARRGGGSWRRDPDGTERRLTGPRTVDLAAAVIATGFGYDAAVRAHQGAVLAGLLPAVGNIRRIGSAALDLCYVAAGRLDGYYEWGVKEWDVAAGGLIAGEAGVRVDPLGAGPFPATVVAARAELFAALSAQLIASASR